MSILRNKYLDKTASSVGAIRNKQYWQLLKRMYGGTDEAIEGVKDLRDSGIYHGTHTSHSPSIIKDGLKLNTSIGGEGVYFGPKILSGGYEDLFRLKKPSELRGTNLKYPPVNNALAVGEGHLNFYSPDSWGQDMKKVLGKYNSKSAEALKFKYHGVNKDIGRREIDNLLIYKAEIPPELLKKVPNTTYRKELLKAMNPMTLDEALKVGMDKLIEETGKSVRAFKDRQLKQTSEKTVLLEKTAAIKEDVKLYPHQERTVEHIEKHPNTIVAHSVGAGKTLTTVAGVERLREKGKAKKTLVVTPASLRENYALNGVKRFTDRSYNIVGNKQELSKKLEGYGKPNPEIDYNVVSYELFRSNPDYYINATGADTLVFDELHRSKNITKTYESIKDSRHLYNNFIGGTGSIVSNKLTDVVPLIDAAEGGVRARTKGDNIKKFEETYFQKSKDNAYRHIPENKRPIVAVKNKRSLGELMKEYVDFADYNDVKHIAKMPDKKVEEVRVPMSKEQYKAYKKLLNDNPQLRRTIAQRRYEYLRDDQLSRLFNTMTEARKLTNDIGTVKPGSDPYETVEQSPKIKKLLDDVGAQLEEHPDQQAVLTSFLIRGGTESLEKGLQNRNVEYGTFLGKGNEGVTEESRQQAVKDYNNKRLRTLVLSSAGGEGLSLNDTQNVYVLDPHYNPERMNQMEARGIRSGGLAHLPEDERKVHVKRYIATSPKTLGIFRNTLKSPDEIIYDIADRKDKQNEVFRQFLKENQK